MGAQFCSSPRSLYVKVLVGRHLGNEGYALFPRFLSKVFDIQFAKILAFKPCSSNKWKILFKTKGSCKAKFFQIFLIRAYDTKAYMQLQYGKRFISRQFLYVHLMYFFWYSFSVLNMSTTYKEDNIASTCSKRGKRKQRRPQKLLITFQNPMSFLQDKHLGLYSTCCSFS